MIRRRPRRSDLAALAFLVAALMLAACGGDDEGQEAVTATADQPVAEETAAAADGAAEVEPGVSGEADAGEAEADDEEAGDESAEPGPLPSAYARRSIPKVLLRLYIQTGEDLHLEWWVIAAVDQIDLKEGNPNIPPRERIPGIGYSLAAAGAPYNDHAALSARAGGAYADRCLKLAGRYVDTVAEQREGDEDDTDGGG